MRIGVIQATSQSDKNQLICDCVYKAAGPGHEVVNFGVFPDEQEKYSYVEIAVCASFLLSSGAVDFIVTGCSSGQGMMLACNALPGVLCGYAPTPQDAFLFGRINGGNAVSLPLGLNFGWLGELGIQYILSELFRGPFGEGYPPEDAERKRRDTLKLKRMSAATRRGWPEIIDEIDSETLEHALRKRNVIDYILEHGRDENLKRLLKKKQEEFKCAF